MMMVLATVWLLLLVINSQHWQRDHLVQRDFSAGQTWIHFPFLHLVAV